MFDIFAESREQARSEAIPWGELEGKCVLIPGATGLIGFACARLLLERNRLGLGPQIRVLCLVRNEERAREIFSAYGEDDGLEMVVGSVEDFPQPEGSIDYIVHTACPTASKFFAEHPVETPWCSARGACWSWPGRRACLAWGTLPAWKLTAMATPSRDLITC